MPRFDVEIELVRWIASMGGQSWFLDRLTLTLVSSHLFRAMPSVVILAGYWAAAGSAGRGHAIRRRVFAGFLASGAALVVSRIIQNGFRSLRPINDPAFTGLFHPSFHPMDLHSFPSDHAAMLVPLVCTIAALDLSAGAATGLLLACAMLARVWRGLHYPSDILAGALLGFVIVWIVHLRPEPVDWGLDFLDSARRRWPVVVGMALFLIAFFFASMFESVRELVVNVGHALWGG
jgi:undecaprenyl-diphosphatase